MKNERERLCVCAKKRKDACDRASGNAHYAFLRIVTSIRTTPFVFLFFCLSLLLCFQLSIFLYAPFSLSPHFTNSLKRTFRILLLVRPFFSIHQHHNILSSPKSSNRTNVKSGVSALSSTSTAFGTAASNARLEQTGNGHIDEALRQQALAEEEAAMNQYKVSARKLLLIIIVSELIERNKASIDERTKIAINITFLFKF